MKSILYYEHVGKSLDDMKPIYHKGPFWAFWLIDLFDRVGNFGLDMRFKIEDRFTFPVSEAKIRSHSRVGKS